MRNRGARAETVLARPDVEPRYERRLPGRITDFPSSSSKGPGGTGTRLTGDVPAMRGAGAAAVPAAQRPQPGAGLPDGDWLPASGSPSPPADGF
jgi:hypothetical protein